MDSILDLPPATTPDPADLLAQLGDGDPRLAALCRFFAERQARAAAEPVEAPRDDEAHRALEQECARLKRICAAMRRDLASLRDHAAMTAAALGACDACWGFDPACPHCAGRGRAGFDSPDPVLYARLVAPAVRRLRRDEGLDRGTPVPAFPDRAADAPGIGPLD